jgi:hypothetical protein
MNEHVDQMHARSGPNYQRTIQRAQEARRRKRAGS